MIGIFMAPKVMLTWKNGKKENELWGQDINLGIAWQVSSKIYLYVHIGAKVETALISLSEVLEELHNA